MSTGRPRSRGRLRRLAGGALAGLILAGVAAGCGSDENGTAGSDDSDEVIPISKTVGGSIAQLAQCRDWVDATEEQQLEAVADIRSQINLEDSGVEAPSLTDEEAAEIFDNACAETYAQGFRLYILYARAVGFAPLARGLDSE